MRERTGHLTLDGAFVRQLASLQAGGTTCLPASQGPVRLQGTQGMPGLASVLISSRPALVALAAGRSEAARIVAARVEQRVVRPNAFALLPAEDDGEHYAVALPKWPNRHVPLDEWSPEGVWSGGAGTVGLATTTTTTTRG